MGDMPQWLTILLGSIVPITVFATFWMTISARLTRAETHAEEASKDAIKNGDTLLILSTSYAAFREKVFAEYIHRSTMLEVEDRLSQAIDRLGDRFDRFLAHIAEKS